MRFLTMAGVASSAVVLLAACGTPSTDDQAGGRTSSASPSVTAIASPATTTTPPEAPTTAPTTMPGGAGSGAGGALGIPVEGTSYRIHLPAGAVAVHNPLPDTKSWRIGRLQADFVEVPCGCPALAGKESEQVDKQAQRLVQQRHMKRLPDIDIFGGVPVFHLYHVERGVRVDEYGTFHDDNALQITFTPQDSYQAEVNMELIVLSNLEFK